MNNSQTTHLRQWKGLIVLAIALILISGLVYAALEFENKTLWDWLELLIVPIALALGAWWLKREERKVERRTALETERRELLATYFDRIQELVLEHNLNDASEGNEVTEIARARTLHALRSINGDRKSHVIRFLVDLGALAYRNRDNTYHSVVRLSYADLSDAELENVHLEEVNLWCANLENTNLKCAHLDGANLPYAFLNNTVLDEASLEHANLEYAVVRPEQLKSARSLKAAIMPDGTTYEEWVSNGEPDWTINGMPETWTPHSSR